MKFTIELRTLIKMVKTVSKKMPGHKRVDPDLRLFAWAARVFVECNETVAGVEALVFEDGQCMLPREHFLMLLDTYRGRKHLSIEANRGVFRIERYSFPVADFSPTATPPAKFQVFPVTDLGVVPSISMSVSSQRSSPQNPRLRG